MADMRRIGAQRNQQIEARAETRRTLFGGLSLPGSAPRPSPARAAAPALGAPVASAAGPTDAATLMAPLRRNALRHVLAGTGAGGVVGAVALGGGLGLPIGGTLGAAAGYMVGQRAAAPSSLRQRRMPLSRKQADPLYAAMEAMVVRFGPAKAKLALVVADGAALDVEGVRTKGGKLRLVIGLALLRVLSPEQIAVLAAQRLAVEMAGVGNQSSLLQADAGARLGTLAASLDKRPSVLRLQALGPVQSAARAASPMLERQQASLNLQADRTVALSLPAHTLANALLCQALVAACGREARDRGEAFGPWLERLAQPWNRAALDGGLRILSRLQTPDFDAQRMGIPVALFRRIEALGADMPLPRLPHPQPAFEALHPKAQATALKTLARMRPKTQASSRGARKPSRPDGDAATSQPRRGDGRSALGRLLARKPSLPTPAPVEAAPAAEAPLFEADALFKDDPAVGIEAYQSLVATQPRWALARLRLGEALVETGFAEGVDHLMLAAEQLPSALPVILETLNGAMAMVSPLEQEPMRQAIARLATQAPMIAEERAGIDLDRLEPHGLDAQDQHCLSTLFDASGALREAWVFKLPTLHMPAVPHHAIIGLAPQVSADEAHALSIHLAEHAAVSGTMVVHIERGRPEGALGDALAAHASFWRAAGTRG